ncbi:MAG: MATE family efflux transporter, partial [Mogibacterium sp.]|nr:MATE family efflux transporter [Mogibacterium sp.]
ATATVINIIGDLALVIVFHMGVAGVALATILAMLISACLMIGTLARSRTCVRLRLSLMRVDPFILRQIFRMGIPAVVQMGITSFSNIIVQGYINQFGADVMSGWTAYAKIDALMLLPIQSIAVAVTTFVGQNIGSGKTERARKGVYIASGISVLITVVLSIPVMIFAPALVGFFNAKPEVVAYGTMIIRWLTPFYFIAGTANIQNSALRGSGDAKTPMILTVLSYVVFRQIYLYIMSHYISNTLIPIAMGYPAGWIICVAATMICFYRADLGSKSVIR